MKNILLTSVGVTTGINVLRALHYQDEYDLYIIGVDMNKYSPHLYLASKGYISPPIKSEKRYFNFITELCDKEKIDMIIPLYSKEIRLFSKRRSFFSRKKIAVIVSSTKTVELCDNKLKFYEFLRKEGYTFPTVFKNKDSINTAIKNGKKVVIKEVSSSGSKNLIITSDIKLANKNLETPNKIVQEYIEGKEFTCDLVADENSEILGIVGRERIQMRNGLAICSITRDISNEVGAIQDLIKKLRIIGPANVQYIKNKEGIFIIEVNPRFAAGGLPLSVKSGINLPLVLLKYAIDGVKEKSMNYTKNLVMMRYYNEIYKMEDKLL
ncbi:MAG: ATP-grasp domain-containing protein [Promethearchaeota archaeon]